MEASSGETARASRASGFPSPTSAKHTSPPTSSPWRSLKRVLLVQDATHSLEENVRESKEAERKKRLRHHARQMRHDMRMARAGELRGRYVKKVTKLPNNFIISGPGGQERAVRYEEISLGCMGPSNKYRQFVIRLVLNRWFELAIFMAIFANTILIGMSDYKQVDANNNLLSSSPYNRAINDSNGFFVGIFCLEMVLKVVAQGFVGVHGSYMSDPWNWLDFSVVALGIVTVGSIAVPSIAMIRTFRVLRPLRSLTAVPGIRNIINGIMGSLPQLGGVFSLTLFLVLVFCICGMQIFGDASMHAVCRLTPFPVNSTWLPGDDWAAFRCLPDNNFDTVLDVPSMTKASSPWAVPQDCFWPADAAIGRKCSLTDDTDGQCKGHLARWCGSDFDALGNRRFCESSLVSYGNGHYALNDKSMYVSAFNYGYSNFDNFGTALFTIFQCITEEGWTQTMYFTMDAYGVSTAAAFYCLLVLMGTMFVLQLLLVVLEENFHAASEADRRQQLLDAADKAGKTSAAKAALEARAVAPEPRPGALTAVSDSALPGLGLGLARPGAEEQPHLKPSSPSSPHTACLTPPSGLISAQGSDSSMYMSGKEDAVRPAEADRAGTNPNPTHNPSPKPNHARTERGSSEPTSRQSATATLTLTSRQSATAVQVRGGDSEGADEDNYDDEVEDDDADSDAGFDLEAERGRGRGQWVHSSRSTNSVSGPNPNPNPNPNSSRSTNSVSGKACAANPNPNPNPNVINHANSVLGKAHAIRGWGFIQDGNPNPNPNPNRGWGFIQDAFQGRLSSFSVSRRISSLSSASSGSFSLRRMSSMSAASFGVISNRVQNIAQVLLLLNERERGVYRLEPLSLDDLFGAHAHSCFVEGCEGACLRASECLQGVAGVLGRCHRKALEACLGSLDDPNGRWAELQERLEELREDANVLVAHDYFTMLSGLLILANCVVLMSDHYPISAADAVGLDLANALLTIFFLVENALRLFGHGTDIYRRIDGNKNLVPGSIDAFQVFDSIVVIASVADIIDNPPFYFGGSPPALGQGPSASSFISVLRCFRLFRIVKLAVKFSGIKTLLRRVANTFISLGAYMLLFLIFLVIYAIVGVQFFANTFHFDAQGNVITSFGSSAWRNAPEISRYNYDDFTTAFATTFQIVSTENWNVVANNTWRVYGPWAVLFPFSIIVLGTYILMNLFLAILLNNFETRGVSERAKELYEHSEHALVLSGDADNDRAKIDVAKRVALHSSGDPNPNPNPNPNPTPANASLGGLKVAPEPPPHQKPGDVQRLHHRPSESFEAASARRGSRRRSSLSATAAGTRDEMLAVMLSEKPRPEDETRDVLRVTMQSDFSRGRKVRPSTEGARMQTHRVLWLRATHFFDSLLPRHQASQDADNFHNDSSSLFPLHASRTLGIFGPDNALRQLCAHLVTNEHTETLVLVLIALSSVCLVIDSPLLDPRSFTAGVLYIVDVFCTTCFSLEMVLKLVAVGAVGHDRAYFRVSWNLIDGGVVLISLLSLCLSSYKSLFALKALRALRALRPLRFISRAPGLRAIVNSLFLALPDVINVFAVVLVVLAVFAVVGVTYLKGDMRSCQGDHVLAVLQSDAGAAYTAILTYPKSWAAMSLAERGLFGGPGAAAGLGNLTCLQWPAAPCCPSLAALALTGALPTSHNICDCWGGWWHETASMNFDNFGTALVAFFSISTTENWVDLMYAAVVSHGPRPHLFPDPFIFVLVLTPPPTSCSPGRDGRRHAAKQEPQPGLMLLLHLLHHLRQLLCA